MVVRWSIEQGRKKRREPLGDQVKFLAAQPYLDAGGFALANAYAQLSRCRPGGFGLCPIDMRAVWEWADRNWITDRFVRKHFEEVILATDARTLGRVNSKSSAKSPPAGPKSPARGKRRRITP